MRKIPIKTDNIYHIFSRSIAEYRIFNDKSDFDNIIGALKHYQYLNPKSSFSQLKKNMKQDLQNEQKVISNQDKNQKLVDLIAYCIMPTHIHLILKQKIDEGISIFMNKILNSYTRYFNLKHNRKGPLWESRFKNVLVKNDEQLLHLTRYIHLNPSSSCLVENPEDWYASSYSDYISINDRKEDDDFVVKDFLKIDPKIYKNFVEDRISYQREISFIKSIIFD